MIAVKYQRVLGVRGNLYVKNGPETVDWTAVGVTPDINRTVGGSLGL
jgi:hypothetical protein